MSILDFGFTSNEDLQQVMKEAAEVAQQVIEEGGLADNNHLKLLQAGYSLKEVYEMTDSEMDALFQSGYQALLVGDFESAKAMFVKLHQLDQLDARYPFALGSTWQLQGNVSVAAKMYLVALGLNATWAEAYVRLGECLVMAQELDEAAEMFQFALTLIADGHGDEKLKQQAEAHLVRVARARTSPN